MHSVRFSSSSSYTPSSPTISSLRRSCLITQNESADFLLERSLAGQIDRIVYGGLHRPTWEPAWTMYVARFTVHFVKGLFAGVGMYTMNVVLVRREVLPE